MWFTEFVSSWTWWACRGSACLQWLGGLKYFWCSASVSKNVIKSSVVGVSAHEAAMRSHPRCVSGSVVGNIKWFNIKSFRGTFYVNVCKIFMWLDTWLINWRRDDAYPLLTWGVWHKCWHESWQLFICCFNVSLLFARQPESIHLLSVNILSEPWLHS